MKKTISILACLLLSLSAGIYYYMNQPKNIFDEIYQETERTYRTNNILRKIDGIDIHSVWPRDSEYLKYSPHATYKKNVSGDYHNIVLGFNFQNIEQTSFIRFDKYINSFVKVRIRVRYNYSEKILTKNLEIILGKGDSDKYIEDETQVRSYLKKYGITAKDLDSYYEKIVNQKVLKDWCSIYKSKYSPKDYGQVTVKTQWEKW
ncbi:TipC family immunity protein [Streptococcus intermedius]|uniref:TipC family immunity protein n=1 Tax=Streptococcus intermedius TaxID=1338 RepID=UPI000E3BB6CC|nr:TipC family immunity protein [Streptococcus intermedius]